MTVPSRWTSSCQLKMRKSTGSCPRCGRREEINLFSSLSRRLSARRNTSLVDTKNDPHIHIFINFSSQQCSPKQTTPNLTLDLAQLFNRANINQLNTSTINSTLVGSGSPSQRANMLNLVQQKQPFVILVRMPVNCHRIIVSNFRVPEHLFSDYFDKFRTNLESSTHQASDILRIVSEEDFVEEVLSDPHNLGICFAPIGMKESAYLNQFPGIRAASIHNKYVAYMARKHNDANVCVLGVNSLGMKLCAELAVIYLGTEFSHEEWNVMRLAIIKEFQNTIDIPIKPL